MFLTKQVNIKVTWNNIKSLQVHYNELVKGDMIDIDVRYLSKGSQLKIDFKCDGCGIEKKIIYKDYLRFNNTIGNTLGYYICPNCKRIESTNEKYGVDNISQLSEIKIKKEETSLDNYGERYYSQTKEYTEQVKKTNVSRYGVEWTTQNKEIRDKQIATNIKLYGVDNPSKNEKIKEKIRLSNITTKHKTILDADNNILSVLEGDNYLMSCHHGHNFEINRVLYYKRRETGTLICTTCNPISKNVSGLEMDLLKFIESVYDGEIIHSNRVAIQSYELDVYIPDLKIAFEFNGVYWHNELKKPKNYHKLKTDLCEEKGIHLFHIWEDDWLYKKELIKSMITNKLGLTKNKLYARKLTIKHVTDINLIRTFLGVNHIQGFVKSSIKIGLYNNTELVSIMLFNKVGNTYELVRYCNKANTTVVGGASKLFKHFIKEYDFGEITTFSDRMYSNGGLYYTLGFKMLYQTKINYYYVVDGIRSHKSNYKKSKLIKDGFDINKSEHEIMLDRGIYRVYNSGNIKFRYTT